MELKEKPIEEIKLSPKRILISLLAISIIVAIPSILCEEIGKAVIAVLIIAGVILAIVAILVTIVVCCQYAFDKSSQGKSFRTLYKEAIQSILKEYS